MSQQQQSGGVLKWRPRTSRSGCKHVEEYKVQRKGLEKFEKVAKVVVHHQLLQKVLLCSECDPSVAWSFSLLACLDCVFIGCAAPHASVYLEDADGPQHAAGHFRSKGHALAVNTLQCAVFCFHCNDYIYDQDFEHILETEKINVIEHQAAQFPGRIPYVPWVPQNEKEAAILEQAFESIVNANFCAGRGLRGLANLGNTCFCSCIIQALVHNPLLRNYFLSGGHRCLKTSNGGDSSVQQQTPSSLSGTDSPPVGFKTNSSDAHPVPSSSSSSFPSLSQPQVVDGPCLGCTMSHIFNEFYNGAQTHFIPHQLLYAMWRYSAHLAGYSQQDAHEFMIAILDAMHSHCGGIPSGKDCTCIIHRIFTGGLQSDITCDLCGHVSSTIDPFWDISLDISDEGVGPSAPVTLDDCLHRFTKTEVLGEQYRIKCTQCVGFCSGKKFSVRKLPVVLCIHLKRFEHKIHASKIDNFVRFPEILDLEPFLTQTTSGEGTSKKSPGDSYLYTLFAVVNHHGTILRGHYTCFVKLAQKGGQWFLADDEAITFATLPQVLSSQAYMLFYIKSRLEYTSTQ